MNKIKKFVPLSNWFAKNHIEYMRRRKLIRKARAWVRSEIAKDPLRKIDVVMRLQNEIHQQLNSYNNESKNENL